LLRPVTILITYSLPPKWFSFLPDDPSGWGGLPTFTSCKTVSLEKLPTFCLLFSRSELPLSLPVSPILQDSLYSSWNAGGAILKASEGKNFIGTVKWQRIAKADKWLLLEISRRMPHLL